MSEVRILSYHFYFILLKDESVQRTLELEQQLQFILVPAF